MESWSRRIPFQVDVAGIIQILGNALYSRSDTPIRELIQNAHDAVMRRRESDVGYQGRIDIRRNPFQHTLTFSDDGVGLSPQEAEQYLSTLGVGVTGILKGYRGAGEGKSPVGGSLIGQFGIGLFSAFMLADRVEVTSRRVDCEHGVRWTAGEGTEITLSGVDRGEVGTDVTLWLKPEYHTLAETPVALEAAIKEYADFLPIPIYLDGDIRRVNVIHVAWFDPTPDREAIELALQEYFDESPLAVIPIHGESPSRVSGALYVTPRRTPGFAGESLVTATVRRMVISRNVRGLLPPWASFLRGVLEVADCNPTASREDLVRDARFAALQEWLEEAIFSHLEELAKRDPAALEAILVWHRYTFAGAALGDGRLRNLLRTTYRFQTSQGLLTYQQIQDRSPADPMLEPDAARVVWYNTDRRQERWMNGLFDGLDIPCVHATRSFEESLLAAFVEESSDTFGTVELRTASPSTPGFATQVLDVHELVEVAPEWSDFLACADAKILTASFREELPVLAFLNEKHELRSSYEDLKKQGNVPTGFQRLIDTHLEGEKNLRNEVLLNREHRLVRRVLSQRTGTPLASVLRLLVINALRTAGAGLPKSAHEIQADDLHWVAEALWGRDPA